MGKILLTERTLFWASGDHTRWLTWLEPSKALGWRPEYTDIREIIAHAWQWHQATHKPQIQTKLSQLTAVGKV